MAATIVQALDAEEWQRAESLIAALPEPRPPVTLYWRGLIALRTGRHAEAGSLLRQALARRADRPTWHHALAEVLLRQERCAAAMPVLATAIALAPARADFRFDHAMCALNLGDTELAEAELRAALAQNPRDGTSLLALGSLLFDQGAGPAAKGFLEQGLALQPEASEARFTLGLVALDQGERELAAAAFARVLAEIPGHVGALYNLARLERGAGHAAAATALWASYQEALKRQELIENRRLFLQMNPQDRGARGELVELLLAAGRSREAVEELNAWRARGLEDRPLLESLERAYRRLGRVDAADAIARQLQARKP